jgi:hypothetical protein
MRILSLGYLVGKRVSAPGLIAKITVCDRLQVEDERLT